MEQSSLLPDIKAGNEKVSWPIQDGSETNDEITHYIDLGSYPHVCLGNINKCDNGFTVSLNYKAPEDGELEDRYIVSNGGQSVLSEGFYFRQIHGKEYQIGVTKASKEWLVEFTFQGAQWHQITWTWNETNGLIVYINGLRTLSDKTGTERFYVPYGDIDPFPRLVVGKSNSDPRQDVTLDTQLTNLTHWESVLSHEEILNVAASVQLQCAKIYESSRSDLDIIELSQSPYPQACLDRCIGLHFEMSLLLDTQCACISDFSPNVVSCASAGVWAVIPTFIVTMKDYGINLNVTHTKPTEHDYIRPGETVTFDFHTATDEDTIFIVDFGDETKKETGDYFSSHSWQDEGSYKVNVTAKNRKKSESKEVEIIIENVHEGTAPQYTQLSASHLEGSNKVKIDIDAFSYEPTECLVQYGDNTEVSYSISANDLSLQESNPHTYAYPGPYILAINCSNAYGTVDNTLEVISQNNRLDYAKQSIGEAMVVDVENGATISDELEVYVDDGIVEDDMYSIADTSLTVRPDVITLSGHHDVHLIYKDHSLLRHVYNVQEDIKDIRIEIPKAQDEVSAPIDIVFHIPEGDHVNVRLDYGDGNVEYVYYRHPVKPLVIRRSHAYDALGLYQVSMEAANDISYYNASYEVSIERPIQNVTFYARNVTTIAEPVLFTFLVDLTVQESMPVWATFTYGDGENEKVELGERNTIPKPLQYRRKYNTHGIFNVTVVVSNNISSVHVWNLLHVGENLTFVDLWTKTDRVEVGNPVDIEIVAPTGSTLKFELDMGDGTTIMVPDPGVDPTTTPNTFYITGNSTSSNETTTQVVKTITNSSNIDVTTPLVLVRRKRSIVNPTEGFNATNLPGVVTMVMNGTLINTTGIPSNTTDPITTFETLTTPAPDIDYEAFELEFETPNLIQNAVIHVYHVYDSLGSYEIEMKASNEFSKDETWLCPQIIVAEAENDDSCLEPDVTLDVGVTTQDAPYEFMKSLPMPINVIAENHCGGDAMTYTWKAFKITPDGNGTLERPALEICVMESSDGLYTMPARTLDYGLYRMSVTVSYTNHKLITSTKEMFVNIGKTPLTAEILGKQPFNVPKFRDLIIDMTPSGDPDVSQTEPDPLLNLDLFCFKEETESEISDIELDVFKNESMIMANDSSVVFYDYNCFDDTSPDVSFDGKIMSFPAEVLRLPPTYIFKLYATKDTRSNSTEFNVKIWSTEITDDLFANIDALLNSGDTSAALMVIGSAADTINNVGDKNDSDAKAERTKLRGKLLNALESCSDNINKPDQLEATTGALTGVTKAKDECTPESKGTAGSALGKLGETVGQFEALEANNVEDITGGVLNTAANILPEPNVEVKKSDIHKTKKFVVSELQDAHGDDLGNETEAQLKEIFPDPCCVNNTVIDIQTGMERTICDLCNEEEIEFLCDEPDDVIEEYIQLCQFERPELRAEKFELMLEDREDKVGAQRCLDKKTTDGSIGALGNVGNVLVSKMDENATVEFAAPGLQFKIAKVNSNSTGNSTNSSMGGGGGAFSLPPTESEGNESVGVQFMAADKNPYTWDEDSAMSGSSVVGIDMTFPNGTKKPMDNLTEPFSIMIKSSTPTENLFNKRFIPHVEKINYHDVTLAKNGSSIHFVVFPDEKYIDDKFMVYLAYGVIPNETYFDYSTVIPNDDDFETDNEDRLRELRHTAFPPQNITSLNGTYYVGIKLLETKMVMSEQFNHSYTFRLYEAKCVFWNETTQKWASDGCEVGPLTISTETHCLCNHLTNFGGDMVVPPNTIDFSTVFAKFAKLNENAAVFSTVVSILILYILGLIWCRRKDKLDLIKWGARPLDDNIPSDHYHYQMTVFTGIKKHSTTRSKISFILSGDAGDTGVRRLYDGKNKRLYGDPVFQSDWSYKAHLQ
ncbi:unnamed protein product [Owenia fusiformis]|uniref:Uncharacterized protein n=1 Tax=Owenia fusiformis TaxID=6347 RepID=A0A8S4NDU1_OWEFU|nr:unnamed protein product [Owenia fusiformis]